MNKLSFGNLTHEEKLKLTVLCAVRKSCREISERQSTEMTFDSDAVELISEMVWKKILDYGSDLEHFAKHAKRASINADDVKLLVRRNTKLKEHLWNAMADRGLLVKKKKKRKLDSDGAEAGDGASTSAGCGENEDDVVDLAGNFDFNVSDIEIDD